MKLSVQLKLVLLLFFAKAFMCNTYAQQRVYKANFKKGISDWVVETNSDSTQLITQGKTLEIIAPKGLTLWYKHSLENFTVIEYEAMVVKGGGKYDRASDLNCFWMANDPENPDDFFKRSSWRNGVFGKYYSLQLYYVGLGGNNNSTTRFRKYDGDYNRFVNNRVRPEIIKEYTDSDHLITANKWCHIKIVMNDGLVQYYYNNELIFSLKDEAPFKKGYFGIRTVKNHMKIRNFKIE